MKVKEPVYEKAGNINIPELDEQIPSFSFKYIVNQEHYNLESGKATHQLKAKVLHSLYKYSKQTWVDFIGDKRQTGVEQVGLSKLKKRKVNLPNSAFYNEVKNVTIFRVSNNEARIVGWRHRNTCYILWIDWDFTSYDHGS